MNRPHLPRRIGLTGAVVLSFNGAVAASIFALPAALAADFGNFSPLMFPIVALAALMIIIPFSWSASAFPESGGPAAYGAVFGRFVGFELGWVYYIARAAAFSANANVLTAYLSRWYPGADQGLVRAAILIGATTLFAAVNVAGVRKSIGLLSGLTVLKAVPLFIAAGAAIAFTFPWPAPTPAPSLTEFEAGLLIVLYAFVGFEQAVVPAGETRDPARNLPRAIFITMAVPMLEAFSPAKLLIADKAYDADRLRTWLQDKGIEAVIPGRAARAVVYPLNRTAYRRRNVIERMFGRLKNWKRIATRYDRLAINYLAAIVLVATISQWLG